jgi:putative ABC transport system permease protein
MDAFRADLRYALRQLTRRPGFALVAVLTVGLGIGANTAIFSVVRAVLLTPLPYRAPDRVVTLWNHWTGWDRTWLSEPEVMDYRRGVPALSDLAAYTTGSVNLTGGGSPERVPSGVVTGNVFRALGVGAVVGRTFGAAEDRPGHDDVVVLSWGLWQRRFGGDASVVGTTIQVDGRPRLVLGVLPRGFRLPIDFQTDRPSELWTPLALNPDSLGGRGSHYLYAVARLAPGAAARQADAELDAVVRHWVAEGLVPATARFGTTVVPVTRDVLGAVRAPLLVLLGAVAFVLLIACANVANLLLARADERQREIALRTAVGASRSRIVTQLLTESLTLALVGGVLGVALAWLGLHALLSLDPGDIPRVPDASLDGVVLAATGVLALLTGVLFGIVPAVQTSRPDLVPVLKEGGRGATIGREGRRFRRALVVSEVALSVVLVIGASLMIRSFSALRDIDTGLTPGHVLTMRLSLPRATYPDSAAIARLYDRLVENARGLPGVVAAGAVRILPLTDEMGDWSITVDGHPTQPGENPHADWQVLTSGYMEAVGMRLVRGRFLTDADRADGAMVAVINQTMARRYWPGEDPIGRRFRLGTLDQPWFTVVGLVGDIRQNAIAEQPHAQMYLPLAQFARETGSAPRGMTLVLRTIGDPRNLAGPARALVSRLDPQLPVSDVQTLSDVLGRAVARPRFTTTLLGVFAALALLLAAVGIYGVIAYTVARRTHEIGVRLTLGAGRRDVVGMVVAQGVAPAAGGVALGVVIALLSTRVLAGLVYGVGTLDPATFVTVPLALLAVALVSSWIPARRAAAVDPVDSLRTE